MFYRGISGGYNNIPWGASLAEVKRIYPEIEKNEVTSCKQNEVFYEMTFGECNSRFFRFYKDKLYWVRVLYKNLTSPSRIVLKEKIKRKYGGKWIDLNEEHDPYYKEKAFLDYPDRKKRDTEIDYSIYKMHDENKNGYVDCVMVSYYSVLLSDELKNGCMHNLEL